MFLGRVVHGDKIGRTFGYPTANLDIAVKDTKATPGVYAAHATLYKKKYNAALIINEATNKVEVYLFQYKGEEFYDAQLRVETVQKVSEIESYESDEELKKKIDNDIELVKRLLKI